MSDKLITAAEMVLLEHRWEGQNCSCKEVQLGHSITRHQARLVLAAVFAALAEQFGVKG